MVTNLTIKKGYKQVEVGVIPEDWEAVNISAACKLINGRGFKPHEWKKEGLPIIRIQNLNGSEDFHFYIGSYDKKIEIENQQLLFAWSGSRGTSFGPHVWKGDKGLLNYHTWKVEIKESKIEKAFFFYALEALTKYIEDKAHGASALVHVQKWEMEKFQFPLPSNKSEQSAIATILSDTDTLIEHLERLIAKKKAIKQGAMQQLLTGKKRLPGFENKKNYRQTELGTIPEDWEVVVFENIADKNRKWSITGGPFGSNLKTSDYTDDGVQIIQLQNIGDGNFIDDYQIFTSEEKANELLSCNIYPNEIILSKMGDPVARACFIPNKAKRYLMASDGIRLVVNENEFSKKFIHAYINSIYFRKRAADISTGTTRLRIGLPDLKSLLVIKPPKSEQTAIATILSDMDAEIESLEQKRDKYIMLKQGMMQQLLTGRIRIYANN